MQVCTRARAGGSPFPQTLRALEADHARGRASLAFAAAGGALLGLWLLWFFQARVTLHAVTGAARLEAAAQAHPVATDLAGRVTRVYVALDDRVEGGVLLISLDDADARLAVAEAEARCDGIAARRALLLTEQAALREARVAQDAAGDAAVEEARAQAAAAERAARSAEAEAARLDPLVSGGVVAAAEAEHVDALAGQRRAEARARAHTALRQRWDSARAAGDRAASLARLEQDAAVLESEATACAATLARLRLTLAHHQVRAPVSGVVGALTAPPPGALLEAGQHVATVIPDGPLRVLADFTPSEALGHVQVGQPARVRLDGFPWSQYGAIPATVRRVAAEPRSGGVRVELDVDAGVAIAVPLTHGLPASVEVALEEVAPATLALRSAGALLYPRAP
ncbi:MAG: HlyD family efflux transporter periplasmic adaptor subunit [Alphaproteobacteria bacterium]|nr:HlyD family efflux transporter periplasmic adaptor subunit [Alphaproteobacteria bacterium]